MSGVERTRSPADPGPRDSTPAARDELVGQVERHAARLQRLALLLTATLVAAAVAKELRKPPPERRWHGRVAWLVPYDLRPPAPARLLRNWWSPDDPRLFPGTAFGVGWDVNLGRLARLLRRAAAGLAHS